MGTFRKSAPPPAAPPVVNVSVPPSPAADVLRRPVIRTGLYAWAVLGIIGTLVVMVRAAGMVNIVVVPMILALFPAAVLAPLVERLKNAGFPPALAALVTMLGVLGALVGLGFALAPQVAGQFEGLGEQLRAGLDAVDRFLLAGPFGLDPIRMEDLVTRVREQLAAGGAGLGSGVVSAVTALTEGLAGFVFGLVALFLYLKDGARIATWLRNLFPPHLQEDAGEVGIRAWQTVGGYVRGQLFIAFVDAVLIGIGLWIVGVPLALPLTVLVFFGGLFPIVGAVLAGAVAALVALATNGLAMALIVLAIIIAVQQIEGNLLAPIVLGKATELHPLATLAALTAGAVLLGVLGAFLAIPVTASITRAASYLRQRRRERESVLVI
jgi:putative heme transporter